MAVQIADDIKQLMQKTICILSIVEIVWMMFDELAKRFTIYIVHQDAIISPGCIANQIRMVKRIPHFEFLLQGCHILRMSAQLWLQAFKEVQFSIESYTIALTCGTTYLQQFGIRKSLFDFRKR